MFAAPSTCATFLSTPSARRATADLVPFAPVENISIHALREEGDVRLLALVLSLLKFLSTPSARRATLRRAESHRRCDISIHALREEGDCRHPHPQS